jgi:transposase-like protein
MLSTEESYVSSLLSKLSEARDDHQNLRDAYDEHYAKLLRSVGALEQLQKAVQDACGIEGSPPGIGPLLSSWRGFEALVDLIRDKKIADSTIETLSQIVGTSSKGRLIDITRQMTAGEEKLNALLQDMAGSVELPGASTLDQAVAAWELHKKRLTVLVASPTDARPAPKGCPFASKQDMLEHVKMHGGLVRSAFESLGCSSATYYYWLRHFGVSKQDLDEIRAGGAGPTKEELLRAIKLAKGNVAKIATIIGTRAVLGWMDKHGIDRAELRHAKRTKQ